MALLALLVLSGTTTHPQSPATLSREQVLRLVDAASGRLRDIEFIYEGSIRLVGEHDEKVTRSDFEQDFQGLFAYRNDRSAHLYVYTSSADVRRPLTITAESLFKHKVTERQRTPDRGRIYGPDRASSGVVGSLDKPHSALRYLLLPRLLEVLTDERRAITESAWETMDGVECLRIKVSSIDPETRSELMSEVYWLDPDRGMNPLRCDCLVKNELLSRDFDISLEKFTASDGSDVWIPTRGTHYSFATVSGYSATPVFEETYSTVNGTLKLNQGLPDTRFSIDWLPHRVPEALSSSARTFHELETRTTRGQTTETRLDQLLADANNEAELLEATAPSREPWISKYSYAIVILVLAVGVIAFGLYRRWRS